ncbi:MULTISPECIES: riboflavin synthase [Corynebacterium]|uniref:riboflavin synthase n=1 Tax=Corynebacterium TaxID=1716 RepID=UPI0008A428FD|nr:MULTISPECIES: riboflavin synthase [Corynebacterium]MTD97200.1 riboflavin synthase [Corynebacterium guaraldiae]OFK63108.1 riboflavin synthase subunit alpha [Corynebacterium sp. HMSC078A10]OFM31169.1 riboflavin synthase subunit alpha [Corynebacterium sp. HMSC072A02]OFP85368.1 riboflavin synthase subunit alpha [Corynebacterium sp. HMSC059E07]OFQ91754.1 riboflavin synthase subunit alpha [Corynebacterium sp. HMSC056E09]
MFTGLVEEVGRVDSVEPQGDAVRLGIAASTVLSDAQLGDSIAVNGVCLTVAELGEGTFIADVMKESLNRSSLGELEVGSAVNLERAVLPTTRLGGHIVQGHVDGTGTLLSRTPSEHWEVLRFSLPRELARYVVEKGSIAVQGTSLTVSAVSADEDKPGADGFFEVSLIPTTLRDTVFGAMAPGDRVNLEVDVVAKYVEKMVHPNAHAAGTEG